MQEVDEIKTILQIIKELSPKVVAIDGVDGSRKSTLAYEILNVVDFDHIELDKYLEKNKGSFLKNLRYREIRVQISQSNNPIIIEGVCILSVLENFQIVPDLLIYNKRMFENFFWRDEKICEVDGDIEKFIIKENQDLKKFGQSAAEIEKEPVDIDECGLSKLHEEIIRYHHQYQPHKKADIIYKFNNR